MLEAVRTQLEVRMFERPGSMTELARNICLRDLGTCFGELGICLRGLRARLMGIGT